MTILAKTLYRRCSTGLSIRLCTCITKLSTIFSLVSIKAQLQNGRHDTSFFKHLRQEQSSLQLEVNMSFRLTSYALHKSTVKLLSLEYFYPQSTGDGTWSLDCNVTPHIEPTAFAERKIWSLFDGENFLSLLSLDFVNRRNCSLLASTLFGVKVNLVKVLVMYTFWHHTFHHMSKKEKH